jgi:4-aminobutyrate aminotransferase
MALAQIAEIRRLKLCERSARLGDWLLRELRTLCLPPQIESSIRGLGLMVGLELRQNDGAPATEKSLHAIKALLQRGFILLPEGAPANVISFTPPLTITEAQLGATVRELQQVFG